VAYIAALVGFGRGSYFSMDVAKLVTQPFCARSVSNLEGTWCSEETYVALEGTLEDKLLRHDSDAGLERAQGTAGRRRRVWS
jgi:hypothetical protein